MIDRIVMEQNEYWWGGTSIDGVICPFDRNTVLEHDFRVACSNQTMPLFLSSHGRVIWSENAFRVKIENGVFEIEGNGVLLESFGHTLRDAYVGAMRRHFPPSGKLLPEAFFKTAQYNTWMQMTYHQTQAGVLKYAHDIVNHGFAPGIFMIDEGWQIGYGAWDFDPVKFPDPKGMVEELHALGFTVMLWVVPYVTSSGLSFIKRIFQTLNPEHYKEPFLRTEDGKVAIVEWWNGYSAILDFTKQEDCDFLDAQLQSLMKKYGVDGFKFDGGNVGSYSVDQCVNGAPDHSATPHERNLAWNTFGMRYRFHEYKDTFKGGGKRSIQRIWDKNHAWEGNGLADLIPCAILQGLLGYPFICPDMIGGGAWTVRELGQPVDQELFVRMAQTSALFPMMQFSWAPWEAVDENHLDMIRNAAKLHIRFSDQLLALVGDCYRSGEPILRNLEYNYPGCGYEKVTDIFMLGDDILVAPVQKKGETVRRIPLPAGTWKNENGDVIPGGRTIEVAAPLNTLPYFVKCRQ